MKQLFQTALATAVVFAAPAGAQDWSYSASWYLFTAETETDIGEVGATLSFSDALENLDAAFMGSFEGSNEQWGFLVDYMLTDLSFATPTPGTDFGNVEASVKTQILTGYLSYRLYNSGSAWTDLLAGARWFDTDTTLRLLPGTSAGAVVNTSDNWIDPVVGVRSRFTLGGDWSGTFVADYGGASDRETWQILLTADYTISENWVGRFGYRHFYVSNDELQNGFSFRQSGPVVGVTYKF